MDYTSYFKFVLVLGFVLGLILLLGWLLKRYGPNKLVMSGLPGQTRRLRYKEVLPVDPKNRFVLLSCDDREFLVLVGHEHSCVIAETQPSAGSQTHEDEEREPTPFQQLLNVKFKPPFVAGKYFPRTNKKADHEDPA